MWTKAPLVTDLQALGVKSGDVVMVHAGLRRIGKMLNGPATFIAALRETVGPSGTLMAYTDWNADYEAILNPDGSAPADYRDEIAAFDPEKSPANRENGAFAEWLRLTEGTLRSQSPGPSCAALGARAEALIANHAFDFGYGPQSPFARLCDLDGKVLLAGAPRDTMTLLHHAEHLANVPDKPLKTVEVPVLINGVKQWRWVQEFNTGDPIIDHFAEDYFGQIVTDAVAVGIGREGTIGSAPGLLVSAPAIRDFAVQWIEAHANTAPV